MFHNSHSILKVSAGVFRIITHLTISAEIEKVENWKSL